jgi:hypothetical protein
MKIRLVEAELIHAEGRTDMTKLTVAFRNCANAPKNEISGFQKFLSKAYDRVWALYVPNFVLVHNSDLC